MIDLHIHLGGAVPSSVLWEILCDGGLHTEFQSFEDLHNYLTVNANNIKSLDDFLGKYFHSTELIQSSPQAAMASVYHAVGKAYRRACIDAIEIRFNPLKRIRSGLHTLDAIILGCIQGLQKASLHYNVKTGAIFSMGKELSLDANKKIIDAAIKFSSCGSIGGAYGIVGIDIAGPESLGKDLDKEWLSHMGEFSERSRQAGLGVTWHVGETEGSGPDGIENVLNYIKPHRIGHGIQIRKAKGEQYKRICKLMRENKVCLEICPSVNLITRSVESLDEIAEVIRIAHAEEIPFCINTDNPYLIHTNLQREYNIMEEALGADAYMLKIAHDHAKQATFLK